MSRAQMVYSTKIPVPLKLAAALVCVFALGAVGAAPSFAVGGELDQSFGDQGVAATEFGGGEGTGGSTSDIALQSDGKIVALGQGNSGPTGPKTNVVRYLPDGRLDLSFGEGGKFAIAMSDPSPSDPGKPGVFYGAAIGIQPDGKIVIGDLRFGMLRLTGDGVLDPSFGAQGMVSYEKLLEGHQAVFQDRVALLSDMTIEPDGDIVAVGRSSWGPSELEADPMLVRYLPDGRLDSSFGDNGLRVELNGPGAQLSGIALDPGGRIVVVGSVRVAPNPQAIPARAYGSASTVLRYAADGHPDPSFGSGGTVVLKQCPAGNEWFRKGSNPAGYDWLADVAITPDGNLVAAGSCDGRGYIAEVDANGAPIKSFGNGGIVKAEHATYVDYLNAYQYRQVVVEPAGEIVATGTGSGASYAPHASFSELRVSATGQRDTKFGTNKNGVVDFVRAGNQPEEMLLQPDRKLLVALPPIVPNGVAAGRLHAGTDMNAPEVTVTIRDKAMKLLQGKGRLPLTITSNEATSVRVDGVLVVSAPTKRKPKRRIKVKVNGKLKLNGPGKKKASLKVGKKQQRKLKRGRRANLRLKVVALDRNGNEAVQKLSRTIKTKRR